MHMRSRPERMQAVEFKGIWRITDCCNGPHRASAQGHAPFWPIAMLHSDADEEPCRALQAFKSLRLAARLCSGIRAWVSVAPSSSRRFAS